MDIGSKPGRPKALDWARAELVKGTVHITTSSAGRTRVDELVQHQAVLKLELLVEGFSHVQQELVGVGFAVPQEAAHLAVES